MQTAAHGSRQVQLGRLAGLTLEPPAPTVRSPALDIRGMAVFHAPLEVRRRAYRDNISLVSVAAVCLVDDLIRQIT